MSFLDAPPGSRRPLYVFLILTLAVGAGASLFTTPQIPTWYASLNHPSITPPNYLFAPVWTTLYILMAIAAWRVWRVADRETARRPLTLFALQLALNLGWSVTFFGLERLGPSVAVILVLELAVVATALAFRPIDRIAAWLLVPYVAWVGFAAILNIAIWRLN